MAASEVAGRAEGEAAKVSGAAKYALAVLTLVYVINFLDRVLIYILFTPIQREMRFSDLQLGLLGATSFAIFYTLLGIPFGRLADRVSRKRLIAAGLAVWSLFSGLTGLAGSFETMFLCRVMVGVGEATLGPAALSLISDYFPLRVRATVQAVFSSAIAVGSGLAFTLGGQIGQALGWRWAFYLLGFPGLLVCLLVLSLREVPRGRTEVAPQGSTPAPPSAAHAPAADGRADWRALFRSAPLRYLYAGYALFGLAANSLSIWGATFFARVHGLDLSLIGLLAGLISVTAGLPGTILGGVVADRMRRRRRGGRMLFGALCALAAVPLWLALLFSGNVVVLLAANFLLLAVSLMWLGAAAADVHELAGPRLRGLGVGIYFFAVNLAAYGIGAPLVGRLNDWLGVNGDPAAGLAANPGMMRYSLLVCPAAAALGALLLWLGSRRMDEER